MNSAYRTWVLSSAAAIIFVLFLTRGDMDMGLITAGCSVLFGLGWYWYLTKGPGAVVQALRRLWLELPGASQSRGLIFVHHETQPLWIRCGRDRHGISLSIHTPLQDSAVAFRLWPKDAPKAPSMGPLGEVHGGPPVERAVHLEMRFANTFHVESSDEAAADRLISEEVALGILQALERSPRGFSGVSYDGQHLGLYLRGPIAADPDQATSVARLVWSTLA